MVELLPAEIGRPSQRQRCTTSSAASGADPVERELHLGEVTLERNRLTFEPERRGGLGGAIERRSQGTHRRGVVPERAQELAAISSSALERRGEHTRARNRETKFAEESVEAPPQARARARLGERVELSQATGRREQRLAQARRLFRTPRAISDSSFEFGDQVGAAAIDADRQLRELCRPLLARDALLGPALHPEPGVRRTSSSTSR